jgi:hypothetical protein
MLFSTSCCDYRHKRRPPSVAKGWPASEIPAFFVMQVNYSVHTQDPVVHLSPRFTKLNHCFSMPFCRTFSKPGAHILRNRHHICSGLTFVWPRFHWCWIEPESPRSRACRMCVCAYATLKFSVPKSLCVTHGAPVDGVRVARITMKKIDTRTAHFLDCFQILHANKFRVRVIPPNSQPEYLSSEAIHTAMPMEAKLQPLVMLVHRPEVVDPRSIERTADKSV